MQNKQKKIEQVNTKQLLMTKQTVRKLQNDIVSTHFHSRDFVSNSLNVYHTILMI